MAEEEVRGPAELVDEDVKISSDSDSDNEVNQFILKTLNHVHIYHKLIKFYFEG